MSIISLVTYVNVLPFSRGIHLYLTIIDCSSKACHLILLKNISLSLETVQLLVRHCFLSSQDAARDFIRVRTPIHLLGQFTTALAARVSLNSGFYPLTYYQTEWVNTEPEATLPCVCSSNPAM